MPKNKQDWPSEFSSVESLWVGKAGLAHRLTGPANQLTGPSSMYDLRPRRVLEWFDKGEFHRTDGVAMTNSDLGLGVFAKKMFYIKGNRVSKAVARWHGMRAVFHPKPELEPPRL